MSVNSFSNSLLANWHSLLTDLSTDGTLLEAAQQAFHLEQAPQPLTELVQQWQAGDFSALPEIDLSSDSAMNGAAGAYANSDETIYLNQDWLGSASEDNIITVLNEELGHHLDHILNESDTSGDEGKIFASLVQGAELSNQRLNSLRDQDDSAKLELDGKRITAEQADTGITVNVDYRFDTNNFFDTQAKKNALEETINSIANRLDDNLAPISPDEENTWEMLFTNPTTGELESLSNQTVPGNTLRVFVGGRQLEGDFLGRAGFGNHNVNGSPKFRDAVATRGEVGATQDNTTATDFARWGGDIAFDTDRNWYFGDDPNEIGNNQYDFRSVVAHEFFHVLGFSNYTPSFTRLTNESSSSFTGQKAIANYDGLGAPPLNSTLNRRSDLSHWPESLTDQGQEVVMDPSTSSPGSRKMPTKLDFAALEDIGWEIQDTSANAAPIARDDQGKQFSTDEDTVFTTGNVLNNDVDPENDYLSVIGVDTTDTLGSVTNNEDGTFNYDPNAEFEALNKGETATDTFQYKISDGNGNHDTDTIAITIKGEGKDGPTFEEGNLVVTNVNDGGEGSLRNTIAQANNNKGVNTITFDSSLSKKTIRLTGGPLEIADSLEIKGSVFINGGNNARSFRIDDKNLENSIDVTLSGLTIFGGGKGGIYNRGENLTLSKATISNNSATGNGVGIENRRGGDLEIINSKIKNNVANDNRPGGGKDLGGGIFNGRNSVIEIINSTVSRNSAELGGGILNRGTLNIVNSTVSENSAGRGGGINNSWDDATLSLKSSTVSGNTAGNADFGAGINNNAILNLNNSIIANSQTGIDISNNETINAEGTNLVETPLNQFASYDSSLIGENFINQDPNLSPLQDNGGLTKSHVLQSGSPAIDAGDNSEIPSDTQDLDGDGNTSENIPYDQRGEDFPRVVGDSVDLGAYEFGASDGGGGSNQPPQLEGSLEDQTATEGEQFNYEIPDDAFSDPDGDELTYRASLQNGDPLPDWLSFNPSDRTFSGTPPEDSDGTLSLKVTAADPGGATASDSFDLAVNDPIELSDASYETLAKNIVYQDKQVDETVSLEGVEYNVEEVFKDRSTGFFGIGLDAVSDDSSILALRGTELGQFNDVLADLNPQGVGFKQFDSNWLASDPNTNVSSWLEEQESPNITGHSLGGALAQWIAADYTKHNSQPSGKLGKVVTFNSPGIASSSKDLSVTVGDFNPDRAQSVEHYITKGDAVSLAGQQFISGNWTVSDFSDSNPLNLVDRHLRPVETDSAFGRSKSSSLIQESFDAGKILNDLNIRSFAIDRIPIPASGGWAVNQADLNIDTAGSEIEISGEAGVSIPPGLDISGSLGLAGNSLLDLRLNQIGFDVSNINKPIANTGAFLQRIAGKINNLSLTSKDALEFEGDTAVTAGADLDLSASLPNWSPIRLPDNLSLLRLDVDATINRNSLQGYGQISILGNRQTNLAEISGEATLDWQNNTLQGNGTLEYFGEFITADTKFRAKADSGRIDSLSIAGDASVNLDLAKEAILSPFDRVIPSEPLSGNHVLDYDANRPAADNFFAGWSQLDISDTVLERIPWIQSPLTLGVEVSLDGSTEVITDTQQLNSIAQQKAEELGRTTANNASRTFAVPEGTDQIVLTADWQNQADDVTLRLEGPERTYDEAAIQANDAIKLIRPSESDGGDTTFRAIAVSSGALQPGDWTFRIPESGELGEVNFNGLTPTDTPQLALTAPQTKLTGDAAQQVDIAYDVANIGSEGGTLSLFYTGDPDSFSGTRIKQIELDGSGQGSATWNTEGVSPGNYSVYGLLNGSGSSPPQLDRAPGRVELAGAQVSLQQGIARPYPQDGSQQLSLTVRASEALSQPITVNYTTLEGTAVAGEDFAATQGSLTFEPGQTERTVEVQLLGQEVPESDRTFYLSLESVENATIAQGGGRSLVTLQANQDNQAPTLSQPPSVPEATEGEAFSFQIPADTFSDPDGDSLSYRVSRFGSSDLPQWLSFDPETRTLSGTPGESDDGTLELQVTASDPDGATASSSFSLTVAEVNDPPQLDESLPDRSATEGESFRFQVPSDTFSDPEGQGVSLSARQADGSELPGWLSFNPEERSFSGTPGKADDGSLELQVTASDAEGETASSSFQLNVAEVNDPPEVANPPPEQQATEGETFSFQVPENAFSDPDDSNLSLSANRSDGSELPGWLSFNAETRTFSGTPSSSDTGSLDIQVTAQDDDGATASDTFQLTVGAPTFSLDVDGNGKAEALSDGILTVRYLFGFQGQNLTQGALGEGATRTEPGEIASFLQDNGGSLDIDGNGQADALTDGILLTRALFGFEGEALTQGVLGEGAQRTQPSVIAERVAQYRPAPAANSSALSKELSHQIPELSANRTGSKQAESPEANSLAWAADGLQPAQQPQLDDGLTASA